VVAAVAAAAVLSTVSSGGSSGLHMQRRGVSASDDTCTFLVPTAMRCSSC